MSKQWLKNEKHFAMKNDLTFLSSTWVNKWANHNLTLLIFLTPSFGPCSCV